MLVKSIIIIFLLIIMASLGSALFSLVKHKDRSLSVVKALTWRIALSLTLFILLLVAFALGWIKPHGI